MVEAQRLLNPWALHLQKLALELKCPFCLQLFNRPMLLPCNHIFCNCCIPQSTQFGSECPDCKHQYVDREVKQAPFMENIVTIYRNLDATFNAHLFQPVGSDSGRLSVKQPTLFKADANKHSRKENLEMPQEGNSSNSQPSQPAIPTSTSGFAEGLVGRTFDKCTTPESGQKRECKMTCGDKSSFANSMGQVVTDKQKQTGVEGIGFMQLEQLSPPLTNESKDTDGNCSDPSSSHGNAVKYSAKRPIENDAYRTDPQLDIRCTSGAKGHKNDVKRQKKMNDGFNKMELGINGNKQTKASETKSVVLDPPDSRSPCAFCHSSKQTDGSGPLLAYANGKEVVGKIEDFSKVIHVHVKCIDWAPQIYFEGGLIKNLEPELARANKLKCTSCGKKGAGLGCYMKSCPRTYHVPCAYDIVDCRWDCDDYLLLCPKHASRNFPREQKSKSGKQDPGKRILKTSNHCSVLSNVGKNLVLCGSALSSEEKLYLVDFATTWGAKVSKYWRENVTHVIAATDSDGACTRTLKVLMAILNGKWILTMEWVKACVEAGRLVNEEPYEVCLDNHGCSGGPKAGRLRVLDNAPKLFNNLKFYFSGDYVQAFKNDLLNLVITAGGTVFESKDQLKTSSNNEHVTLVVYNTDLSDDCSFEGEDSIKCKRLGAAEGIAQETKSHVIGHTWILESIAASCLLPITSDP